MPFKRIATLDIKQVYATDENGKCSFPLNLNSANYPVNLTYLGNGKYLPSNFTGNVLIKPTVVSNNITKIFRNATPFTAKILDNNGNVVKIGFTNMETPSFVLLSSDFTKVINKNTKDFII